MLLWEIEPYACGYYYSKHTDTARRIADGMLAFCRYMPLSIDPEIGFASIDRRTGTGLFDCKKKVEKPEALAEFLGVRFTCGDGIFVNKDNFDRETEEHPELKEDLQRLYEFFAPLHTYKIFTDTYSENEKLLHDNNTLWGGTWGGHSNPDYGMLIKLGTDGLREKIAKYRKINEGRDDFYEALLTVLDGIDILAGRFASLSGELAERDPKNAKVYRRIEKAFRTVPKKGATDLPEALQLFYLVFTLDGRDSPGTFDRYIGRFYDAYPDKAEAREMLEGVWRGFYKTRAWNLCIGGSDENWNDTSNALSMEILDIAGRMGCNTPNLTMRVHRNTSDKMLYKAAEVIGTGIGMPALYNDEVVCPALEDLGIPAGDSHLYAMNGCNQIDIQGKSHMGLEDGEACLLKCLEYALFDGKCLHTGRYAGLRTGDASKFSGFEELMDAYKKQVEFAVKKVVELSNRSQEIFAKNAPNPLRSLLLEGCIEKGRDYKSGGPLYNHGQILTEGLSDTTDSLAVLRHFVFESKKYTMSEVLTALEADYEGYEEMYREFGNYEAKFGNDNDEADTLGAEILRHYFTEMAKYRTFRDPVGGIYGGGMSTFQRTGRYGGTCGASASGRHKGSGLIADSIGAVPGRDTNGPTAVIKSALKYDQRLAKSGFVLQLKFDKKLFNTEKGREAFVNLVKTYFANGGQQLSVNVLSQEELLEAKKHPEEHRNLIVRVGGFSDYFVNLSDALQDNIIARSVQSF